MLDELVSLAVLCLKDDLTGVENGIAQQNRVDHRNAPCFRELSNVLPLELALVGSIEFVFDDSVVFCFDFLQDLFAVLLKVLGVFLQATQDRGPVEIVLEKVDLSLIREIVAARVETVDVDTRESDVVQILVEALLRGELSAVWEVVIELVASEHLVDVLIAIRELPLDVEQVAPMAGVLDPAECLGRPLYEFVL